MIIDVHAHFWPQGVLDAAAHGRPWFGWEPVTLADGRTALALGDRLVRFPVPAADLLDVEARSSTRQQRSVDAEVAMPVGFLWNQHLSGRAALDHAREVNAESSAAQHAQPGAFVGLGILPLHAPEHLAPALDELADLGLGAVALPASVRGVNLDDDRIMSVVGELIEAGLGIVIHPTYLDPPGALRMSRYYFTNSIGASLECTVALMSLIHGGLFDRHPDPRIVVVQGGGSVPYEIGRFSLRYREREDLRTMALPPEAYLRQVHYDCMVADSESLAFLIGRVGADRIVLGTDFPFKSDVVGGASAWVQSHPGLDPEERSAILGGNARRLFGL